MDTERKREISLGNDMCITYIVRAIEPVCWLREELHSMPPSCDHKEKKMKKSDKIKSVSIDGINSAHKTIN